MQGIGQILSPLEFYCKELIKHSEVQKKIGKSGHNYNSNKGTILSSKQFSLVLLIGLILRLEFGDVEEDM